MSTANRTVRFRERDQHQNLPQKAKPMNHSDPDMPAEIDFSGATRGKFYRENVTP